MRNSDTETDHLHHQGWPQGLMCSQRFEDFPE